MENFIVSARKYRPITFDTVVGQNSITSTLKNAIKNNHLAQAFLFCGPRGVGKTTCARILAKTINCENRTSNVEACNVCKPCQSFNTSNSFNVFELDAASNNSVDDIRNLVDQVRIPPQIGQYKIYIIDEVHMLSASAFNAFLKTLEEPPPYAKFILATTEKHKIIPTILSRCQVFDFSRITIDDIAKHLAFVAKSENVTYEIDALHIIAQKADGALRDALSIFDQIVSFAGDAGVTYKDVINNLNILDYDYFFEITDSLLQSNIPKILLLLNEIIEHGFDGHHFITGLGEHFRNLLVCKDASTIKLLEVGDNIRQKYRDQAQRSTAEFLLRSLDLVAKCDVNYKSANNKRLMIELALMQMCTQITQVNTYKEIPKAEVPKQVKPSVTEIKTTPVEPVKKVEEIKKTEEIKEVEEIKKVEKPSNIDSEQAAKPAVKIIAENKSIFETIADAEKKSTEQKIATVAESNAEYKKPATEFTKEQFEKVWKNFAQPFQKESPDLFIVLTSRMPTISDDFKIELMLDNVVQENEINEKKMDLLEKLRKELNNYEIQLTTVINKNP
ncbi:MAG: DNA polymerase III subunit gamma/tau, partial [Bacteroidetes bacterium]|nr:DNA polymerase III subunit gamma/tau [Bacteroidota bacterium]